jgi:hypothetical protein
MLLPLLISITLALPTGTIEGSIAPPEKVRFTKPVQVAVFPPNYVNLYRAELQKRVDSYWEDYKLAFIQNKEAFLLFQERAKRQAMDSTLNRMQYDDPRNMTNFVHAATNNTFEFHSVPQGECEVLALVTIGNQEFIWSDSVILTNETPAFVVLKPSNP